MSEYPDSLRLRALNALVMSETVPRHRRPRLMRLCRVAISDDCLIVAGTRFGPGPIEFGHRVGINRNCFIDPGEAGISFGDDVGIGAQCVISAAGHNLGPSYKRAFGPTSSRIVIERGCWIGTNTTVLPGVTIREGCVVGAGAVVTSSTEPDGVYLGVPARRVRELSREGQLPISMRHLISQERLLPDDSSAASVGLADVPATN